MIASGTTDYTSQVFSGNIDQWQSVLLRELTANETPLLRVVLRLASMLQVNTTSACRLFKYRCCDARRKLVVLCVQMI